VNEEDHKIRKDFEGRFVQLICDLAVWGKTCEESWQKDWRNLLGKKKWLVPDDSAFGS
jgi:hypothetical protein